MSEQFIEEINALLEQNKPKIAYKRCQKKLLSYTDKRITKKEKAHIAEIYYVMGSILASCKELDEAVSCLGHAIDNNPKDESYYYYRAEMKVALADYHGAIEDYSKCVRINPTNTYYGKRGSAKMQIGDIKGAMKDCSKAIELNPNFGGGYIERGNIKLLSQDFVGAIEDYSACIKLFPDYSHCYSCRAEAKHKMGDIDGAIKDYKKIKQLEPRNEEVKNIIRELSQQKKEINKKTITIPQLTFRPKELPKIHENQSKLVKKVAEFLVKK